MIAPKPRKSEIRSIQRRLRDKSLETSITPEASGSIEDLEIQPDLAPSNHRNGWLPNRQGNLRLRPQWSILLYLAREVEGQQLYLHGFIFFHRLVIPLHSYLFFQIQLLPERDPSPDLGRSLSLIQHSQYHPYLQMHSLTIGVCGECSEYIRMTSIMTNGLTGLYYI